MQVDFDIPIKRSAMSKNLKATAILIIKKPDQVKTSMGTQVMMDNLKPIVTFEPEENEVFIRVNK